MIPKILSLASNRLQARLLKPVTDMERISSTPQGKLCCDGTFTFTSISIISQRHDEVRVMLPAEVQRTQK